MLRALNFGVELFNGQLVQSRVFDPFWAQMRK
jgi:hypothetical protein